MIFQCNLKSNILYNGLSKTKDYHILKDIDTLKEEKLKYSNILHNLKSQNHQLKEKIKNKEQKLLKKKDKLNSNNLLTHNQIIITPNKNSLAVKLKNLEIEKLKKENDLKKVKHNKRYTKINELQIDSEEIAIEMERINGLLSSKQIYKIDENELYSIQANILKSKQDELSDIFDKLAYVENQLIKEQEKNKELIEQKKKYEQETIEINSEIQKKEVLIKNSLENPENEENERYEIELKERENNNLKQQISEKNEKLRELEEKIKQIYSEYNKKIDDEKNEKELLQKEYEQLINDIHNDDIDNVSIMSNNNNDKEIFDIFFEILLNFKLQHIAMDIDYILEDINDLDEFIDKIKGDGYNINEEKVEKIIEYINKEIKINSDSKYSDIILENLRLFNICNVKDIEEYEEKLNNDEVLESLLIISKYITDNINKDCIASKEEIMLAMYNSEVTISNDLIEIIIFKLFSDSKNIEKLDFKKIIN